MSFNRVLLAQEPATEVLTGAMVGIGMNFAAPSIPNANIEDTLFFASIEGMERSDLRVLSVLVQWLSVHSHLVNADRLIKLVEASDQMRTRAFWTAVALWRRSDRRFLKMGLSYLGLRVDLLENSDFQIKRYGEDPRFTGGSLRVPAKTLRERDGDVLSPCELAQRHQAYYFRVMMGPSYRADAWATLEQDPCLSTAELARKSYCAFATAWQVKRDFLLLQLDTRKAGGLMSVAASKAVS
jgi:hypothetical protein